MLLNRRSIRQVASGRRGRSLACLVGISAGGVAIACTTPIAPVSVATITLAPGFDSLEVGAGAVLFTVELRDSSGKDITGRSVQWRSQNQSIATVDGAGRVQGVAVGQSVISATVDGKSANAVVRVLLPIFRIILTPDSVEVRLTTFGTIGVQLLGPAGEAIANRALTWASANPSIATISVNGVVTPFSVGTTTVSVTAGSKSATAKVVVKPEPVVTTVIRPSSPVQIVRLTGTLQLTAECLSVTGLVLNGRPIEWNSTGPTVAAVSANGLVSGLSLGSVTISATCEGPVVASVVVQVTPVPVASVAIVPGQVTVLVGGQQQLSAVARDSAGNALSLTNRNVVWTSDNVPVATVSGVGVVQGVSVGSAQVQVTVDGLVSLPIPVTVQNVPVTTVAISPNPGQVLVNSVVQLTATLRDANGNILTGRPIVWRSLNANVATVSATGIVGGIAPGQVSIEAECEGVIGVALITVNP